MNLPGCFGSPTITIVPLVRSPDISAPADDRRRELPTPYKPSVSHIPPEQPHDDAVRDLEADGDEERAGDQAFPGRAAVGQTQRGHEPRDAERHHHQREDREPTSRVSTS